jgi:Recombinase/Recombinase zinc beta ribbon domain
MYLQMMFVFAEHTRTTLKESWATSQRSAVEKGIHIAPNDFFGYDRVDRRLVPNTDAPTVVEAFRRRGKGDSWTAIADWLNEVAPRETGAWNGQSVQRLCAKRVYRGEASRYVAQDRDGRGLIVNSNAHPALVTEKEWRAAQMEPRLAQPRGTGDLPLLSGLIRCAGCRFGLSQGRGAKGERLYRCRVRHASGRCPSPACISADAVEAHVEGRLLDELEAS